jgi:hypothetical protein
METPQQESSEIMKPTATLQVTPESVSYLGTAAKWSKFLSIIGFIITGFLMLAGITLSVFYATVGKGMGSSGLLSFISPGLLGSIYIVIAIFYLWPVIYLNNFSNFAARAVKSGETELLTKALRNLKRLFLFIGILTIAILVIYMIAIIAIVVAGSLLL